MNACQYITELGLYLDGELDARRRRALEAHLPGCAACRLELVDLRSMAGLFAEAEEPVLPAAALWRLHGRVNTWVDEAARGEDEAERAARGVLRITRVLTGIAACVLVAGSLWLVQSHRTVAPRKTALASTMGVVEPWEKSVLTGSVPDDADTGSSTSAGDMSADIMAGGLLNPSSVSASEAAE